MRHLIKKTKRIAIVIAVIFALFPFKKAYAQMFSWSGMIELSFRDRIEKSKAGDYETKTDQKTFQQRYFLNINGPVVDPRIAIFSIGTTFTHTWDALDDEESRIKDYGYNIATTLFPQRFFPLTLYTNRFITDTDSPSYGSRKTTTVGYGLRWSLMLRSLPTTRLLMEQTETVSDDPQQRKDERKREAALELNKVTPSSVFFARYKYVNELERIMNSTSDTHSVDMNFGSQLTNILHLRTFGSYQTTGQKDEADTDLTLKDNFDTGAGLYFRPTIYLDLTTDYNYNYTLDESYASGERFRVLTRRHQSSTTLYFHPDPRLDSRLGYHFTKTIATTDIDSHQIALNLIEKPITGLTLTENASYLQSKSTSELSYAKSRTQNYGGGFSYTLPFKNFIFNSSYMFNYSIFDVKPGEDSHSMSNLAGAGIAYNFNIALITTDYFFTARRDDKASGEGNRDEHKYRIGLASYFIKGLAVSANLEYDMYFEKKANELWIKDEVIILDSKLDYNVWRTLFVSGGYSIYDYSNPASSDNETVYAETRMMFFPIANLLGTVRIRGERSKYSLYPAKDTLLGEARLDYRIRKLLLSAEYNYSFEKYQEGNETRKNMIFFRVTRAF